LRAKTQPCAKEGGAQAKLRRPKGDAGSINFTRVSSR